MISVIIPSYNYGHFIAQAIDSVLAQTYRDLEVIVIDDGSADDTEEAVQHCCVKDSRVSYYKYTNAGLSAARNRGLDKIRGEYIQFLDADDLIEQQKFEQQLKLLAEHPEADIVYGSVRYFTNAPFDPADRKLTYWGSDEEWMPKLSGKGSDLLPAALKGNFSHLSSMLFRKSIVIKAGLFDTQMKAMEDYQFLLRCVIANAGLLYHDTPGTYSLVRWHPDNMSKNLRLMWSEDLAMRKKLAPLLEHDAEAKRNNEAVIKGDEYKLAGSWKKNFLSGGRFEFVKKVLRTLGLEKLAKKIFYKQN
jgi:glycosyltransferase involved in cell wall biosynthesis